ncbi:hypothetical protein U9M48_026907 [Paspalum notatum var. saurae]|uniref:Uncharacterized protein n=1 Tax=Paspalum notatum var. saurae TaxID=547442 RepID=A0AAQ3TTP9_PASNO
MASPSKKLIQFNGCITNCLGQLLAVVSKDTLHSKSVPRISKLLGIEAFECLGPSAAELPMHCSEEEGANISGKLKGSEIGGRVTDSLGMQGQTLCLITVVGNTESVSSWKGTSRMPAWALVLLLDCMGAMDKVLGLSALHLVV